MRRAWQIWLAFAAALLLAITAVGWLSFRALESEQAELTARGRAALEENSRLALWRLDSAVAPLIAEENARPYFVYRAFFPAGAPQNKPVPGKLSGQTLVPSPLLAGENPRIRLHFEFDVVGVQLEEVMCSPSVPTGALVARAVPEYISAQTLERNRQQLFMCARRIDKKELFSALATENPPAMAVGPALPPAVMQQPLLGNNALSQQSNNDSQPASTGQLRGDFEFQARQQAILSNNEVVLLGSNTTSATNARIDVMTPLWFEDELFLARHVTVGTQSLVQGCWLDWPLIREQLLTGIRDLLPEAQLAPDPASDTEDSVHRMAALPVKLLTGELPAVVIDGLSPLRLSLLVTWGLLLVAAMAVALLLSGVMALSERRAAFVSAVTHELRTPLTTFRMYAEMLAEGMVTDEATRRGYLETLRVEADRLTHLVENVLAYARLERGGPAARIGPVGVKELLERASERLAGRAAQAGLTLRTAAAPEVLAMNAVADPGAVEQILFNLVDNACKYAAGKHANSKENVAADAGTLELDVDRCNGSVRLRVRDHGPGVPEREQKRLFQPFRKSAHDAANSAPGVGLGLALSRRLARDMGGELSLDGETAGGACFVLTLRAVEDGHDRRSSLASC
ncbi:MAG TPA: HAMP domain-containing sensor histidine kinase [Pirellulales bacterium]|jgi:signal transduction histidine kinase|nr:HAMP domain-containing sensor histidine kinase [Pirellulales bacterium]